MKVYLALFFSIIVYSSKPVAQPLSGKTVLTHGDTLRGTYGPERAWWDVLKYDLHVKFNIGDSTISGFNIISFKVLKTGNVMQIDLQAPMVLDSISIQNSDRKSVKTHQQFRKDGNA